MGLTTVRKTLLIRTRHNGLQALQGCDVSHGSGAVRTTPHRERMDAMYSRKEDNYGFDTVESRA